jgi:hypothetical protein
MVIVWSLLQAADHQRLLQFFTKIYRNRAAAASNPTDRVRYTIAFISSASDLIPVSNAPCTRKMKPAANKIRSIV